MFNMGFSELIVILLVAFVIVGPKDLPKVARALGRAFRYLKNAVEAFKEETGLDEAIGEFKSAEKEIKAAIKENDPTKDIVQAGQELKTAVQDAEKDVKAGLEQPKAAEKDG